MLWNEELWKSKLDPIDENKEIRYEARSEDFVNITRVIYQGNPVTIWDNKQ